MKIGDIVYVLDGKSKGSKYQGILVDMRDNPADVENNFHYGREVRKIADVLSGGKVFTTWLNLVEAIDDK